MHVCKAFSWKSLWIKASAKLINVYLSLVVHLHLVDALIQSDLQQVQGDSPQGKYSQESNQQPSD